MKQGSTWRRGSMLVRSALLLTAVCRFVGATRRSRPLAPSSGDVVTGPGISIIVPARDEANRIAPLLNALRCAPGVSESIVVDDQSADATAALAVSAGARVVTGKPLPPGWAGKAWALQQGIAEATGPWVVTLDADTRPDPRLPSALVARMIDDGVGFATVAGSFECPTLGVGWLHPAMLTTLVYRFGPPAGVRRIRRPMANGQCMAFRLGSVSLEPARAETVEDVALVRQLERAGMRTAMYEAPGLLVTRMYENLADAWSGWGRSLALPGVEPRRRQLVDLAVVASCQALPLPRLLLGVGDAVDVVAAMVRLGTLVGTRASYRQDNVSPASPHHRAASVAYWLSPLADLPATIALARSIATRRQTWRGRTYH